MGIGDVLAEGRRQAGLTIAQVSHRTCIRETIIRGIERGDFSGCGGDFYARGHIRSIANVVGVDPEPLIDQYDATMGAPKAISAREVFHPVTPVKLKERRRPNWTAALAAAILLIGGVFAYQHFSARSATPRANTADKVHNGAASTSRSNNSGHHSASAAQPTHAANAADQKPHHLTIDLTATQNCWVQLATLTGRTIFSGMVYAGSSMTWTERHAVRMLIGNPAGIRLLVNGKNAVPRGTVHVVTLSLHSQKA